MSTMVRGQYYQLMAPGLHGIFNQWTDTLQRDEMYSKIFHMESSDKMYEDEIEMAGLPPMPYKPEGESIIYQDVIQGGTFRYIVYTYSMGVRMSYELYADDQYNIINQSPKAIARSAHFTKETKAWSVFNLGFTSQVTTDGVSLFNNQHPLLGGTSATSIAPGISNVISAAGTYPNRPATDLDLSFTALELAGNQYRRMIDGQGLPVVFKPRFVLIPPELIYIAREILGSPNKPYTSDNEVNALVADDLQIITSIYLTSPSAWFLLPEKESHTLKFLTREELNEDFSDDFDTKSLKMQAQMRFAYGATSWMGVWGSNGP